MVDVTEGCAWAYQSNCQDVSRWFAKVVSIMPLYVRKLLVLLKRVCALIAADLKDILDSEEKETIIE